MLGFYDYTVILTYISVASSVIGMGFAINEMYLGAVICLLFSGLCDMFDGMVARTKKNRTEMEKKNGIQLDSLADVVCFGAFPACLGFCISKGTVYHIPAMIIGVLFVLCAIIRLAYFNVTEEERQKTTAEKRKNYEGLPVTTISLILPPVFILKNILGQNFSLAYCIVLLCVAMCFIIKFKVKKMGKIGNTVMICFGILVFAILIALKVNGL